MGKIQETALHEKEDFCNHLNMEDIADADNTHEKRVCKDFEIKNIVNIMICIFNAINYC